MQQKELAVLLGISPAMVSRQAKRGMPTDTLERAERWRKRHLEPSRVKGIRYDTFRTPPPARQSAPVPQHRQAPSASLPGDLSQERLRIAELAGPVSLETVEAWSEATHHAQTIDAQTAGDMLAELRALLRRLPADGDPRMALGVWLALTDFAMHNEAELRQATDLDTLLDPNEFAARVTAQYPNAGGWWLWDVACDWEGYAVSGWPAGWEDD